MECVPPTFYVSYKNTSVIYVSQLSTILNGTKVPLYLTTKDKISLGPQVGGYGGFGSRGQRRGLVDSVLLSILDHEVLKNCFTSSSLYFHLPDTGRHPFRTYKTHV